MFVENCTATGFINLDHIATARRTRDGRGYRLDLFGPDGRELGSTYDDLRKAGPVLPAVAGFTALRVHHAATEGEWIEAAPVVAWRVSPTFVTPIIIDGDGDLFAVELPDGRVVEPALTEHENRAAWLDYHRGEARADLRGNAAPVAADVE